MLFSVVFRWMNKAPLIQDSGCGLGAHSRRGKMGHKKPAPHVKCPEMTVVSWPDTTKAELNINKTSGK